MNFLKKYFPTTAKPSSAQTAKERLQIIISHERSQREVDDFLPGLQQELIDVIAKYFPIQREQLKVALERHGDLSVLELNLTLPHPHLNEELETAR